MSLFDFLKDELPTENYTHGPAEVKEQDIRHGKLDLNKFTSKYNCSWMETIKETPPAASILCNDLYALIDVLPYWKHKAPLNLYVKGCSNFKGGQFPPLLKRLHIESCPDFTGESISDIQLDSLTIVNCGRFEISNIDGSIKWVSLQDLSDGFMEGIKCSVETLNLHNYTDFESTSLPKGLINLILDNPPLTEFDSIPDTLARVVIYNKENCRYATQRSEALGEFLITKGFEQLETEGSGVVYSHPDKDIAGKI